MARFKILAQSITTSQRIAKVVEAKTAEIALRMVYQELHDAGFYPLSCVQQEG